MTSKIIRIFLILAMLSGLVFLWSKSGEWRNAAREEATRPDPALVARSEAIIGNLDITDLKGKPVQLPGTGRYRLINYWATWCGPCLMEMPLLDQFAQTQAKDGVLVIGIALDEAKDVAEYLKETPSKYVQLLEKAGKNDSSSQLGNQRGIIPYSVLIDPQGRLLKVKRGPFSDLEDLESFSKLPEKPAKT